MPGTPAWPCSRKGRTVRRIETRSGSTRSATAQSGAGRMRQYSKRRTPCIGLPDTTQVRSDLAMSHFNVTSSGVMI
jgi:hypothetical protein